MLSHLTSTLSLQDKGEKGGSIRSKTAPGSSFQTLLTNFPAFREWMTDHPGWRWIAHQSEMVVFGTRRQHIPSISAGERCCRELIHPPPSLLATQGVHFHFITSPWSELVRILLRGYADTTSCFAGEVGAAFSQYPLKSGRRAGGRKR